MQTAKPLVGAAMASSLFSGNHQAINSFAGNAGGFCDSIQVFFFIQATLLVGLFQNLLFKNGASTCSSFCLLKAITSASDFIFEFACA